MQPVKPLDGVAEDEALVFREFIENDDGDEYELVTDDETIDRVYRLVRRNAR